MDESWPRTARRSSARPRDCSPTEQKIPASEKIEKLRENRKACGRTTMDQPQRQTARLDLTVEQRESAEVIKLIRKLRWIGLENEARELQDVLTGLPVAGSGTLVAGPHSTD